jgi:hypothetical protein
MKTKINEEMQLAIGNYTGPITKCRPGRARAPAMAASTAKKMLPSNGTPSRSRIRRPCASKCGFCARSNHGLQNAMPRSRGGLVSDDCSYANFKKSRTLRRLGARARE